MVLQIHVGMTTPLDLALLTVWEREIILDGLMVQFRLGTFFDVEKYVETFSYVSISIYDLLVL